MSTPPDEAVVEPLTIRRFGSGGTTRIGVETFIVAGGEAAGGVVVVLDSGLGIGVEVFGVNVPGVVGGADGTVEGGAVIVGGAAG